MTSSDHEILISIQGEIHSVSRRLESLERRMSSAEETQALILQRLSSAEARLSGLKGYMNTCFAVIAVIIALAGFFVQIASARRDLPASSSVSAGLSVSDIREIVRLELSREGRD